MHEGHRQRMYSKLENGEDLFEHEILEILLFNAYPRINTNEIAHALLDRFISINGVLNAEIGELAGVKMVGLQTAKYLKCVGECLNRANKVEGVFSLKTRGDCTDFVSMRLNGKKEEFLEIYFTGRNGDITRVYSYTSADRNKVLAEPDEIIKNIALAKPYGILVAHNHVNGSSSPSVDDDVFTATVRLICDMNKVKFLDHMIYAGENNIFSYFDDGRMEKINRRYSVSNFSDWVRQSAIKDFGSF